MEMPFDPDTGVDGVALNNNFMMFHDCATCEETEQLHVNKKHIISDT